MEISLAGRRLWSPAAKGVGSRLHPVLRRRVPMWRSLRADAKRSMRRSNNRAVARGRVVAAQGDVSKSADIQRAYDEIMRAFSRSTSS
jgi:hypothetical protein